MKDHINMVH